MSKPIANVRSAPQMQPAPQLSKTALSVLRTIVFFCNSDGTTSHKVLLGGLEYLWKPSDIDEALDELSDEDMIDATDRERIVVNEYGMNYSAAAAQWLARGPVEFKMLVADAATVVEVLEEGSRDAWKPVQLAVTERTGAVVYHVLMRRPRRVKNMPTDTIPARPADPTG